MEDARHRRHRYLQTYTDEDGMLVIRARLEPESGAALLRALDAASERLFKAREAGEPAPADEPDPGQKRADALALVAESALGDGLSGASDRAAGDRYQVVVHIDAEALAEGSEAGHSVLEGGIHVSAETSRRLACDASRIVMKHDREGRILDVGRKTRTVPPPIRRALAFRDQGCRFPGCDARICDAHHVRHWADGGETRLDNLVLLCRRHHTAIHHEGFRVRLRPDGSARFFGPKGRPISEAPLAPKAPERPVAALRQVHAVSGLSIGPNTAHPSWGGERFDLSWALDVYRSLGGRNGRSQEPVSDSGGRERGLSAEPITRARSGSASRP